MLCEAVTTFVRRLHMPERSRRPLGTTWKLDTISYDIDDQEELTPPDSEIYIQSV